MSQENKRKPFVKRFRGRDVCNICGLPGMVTYTEIDRETGKATTTTHEVDCIGHEHIQPWLWNKHPDFQKYQELFAWQRATSRKQK